MHQLHHTTLHFISFHCIATYPKLALDTGPLPFGCFRLVDALLLRLVPYGCHLMLKGELFLLVRSHAAVFASLQRLYGLIFSVAAHDFLLILQVHLLAAVTSMPTRHFRSLASLLYGKHNEHLHHEPNFP